jgi:RNA polymerase sigma factor (sigma-70 family)
MPLMPHLDMAAKGSSALAPLSGVGDHAEALERVYRERSVGFRNALAVISGGHEQARDAVQEAFAVALREQARFRGEGPLEAWVFRIALRLARRESRRSNLGAALAPTELPEAALPTPERDPVLAEALRGLSPRRRQIVFLRYFADLSYAAIADLAGVRAGTVAATLAQAHEALRHVLDAEEVAHDAR